MSPADRPAQFLTKELLAGVRILDEVMHPFGFEFKLENEGSGSGGRFANGSYCRDDRRLELHFRGSLGMVTYRIADSRLRHVDYMRFLGVYGKNGYPDFSDDPLDSFRELAKDISQFASDFTKGSGAQFKRFATELKNNPAIFSGLMRT